EKGPQSMKKFTKLYILIIGISLHTASYANWFDDIVKRIEQTNGINTNILNNQNASLDIQRDILSSQKDIEMLMRQVDDSMHGHSGWGGYQFHDYQSYGIDASDWSRVMKMGDSGYGSGVLGQTMRGLSNEFPVDRKTYNGGITNSTNQKYYALKSQTILAARAASQLDYSKIQEQITYQQMLQQQIENTKDLKAAIDLSNRIQVEGNLINLGILRQTALANQQQAVSEQDSVNVALTNARFLTKN
ncbi:MAG: type IV secretion system protein, partial [Gammaproteobacteria bacterium]